MAQKTIELGTAPDGMDGDDARTAFQKTNDNFTELYQGVGGAQPASPKLSAIAASVWAANTVMVATGAESLSVLTYAQFKTALALNNVDNTSDANKPVSTATQTALNTKQPLHANLSGLASLSAAAGQIPIFASVNGSMSSTFAGAAGRQVLGAATLADVRTLLDVSSPHPMSIKSTGSFNDWVGVGWAPQVYDGALANSPISAGTPGESPSSWYLHNIVYNAAVGIFQIAYPYNTSLANMAAPAWRHLAGDGVWRQWTRFLSGSDLVAGTYDATPGRVVTTGVAPGGGWMGLGATSIPAAANLDSIAVTSFYTFNETAVGRPSQFGYGNVLTICRGANEATQVAYSVVSSNAMSRRKLNGAWSGWVDATPLGIAQQWTQVTRNTGTTYTNDTTRPLILNYACQALAANHYLQIIVNGIVAAYSTGGYAAGGIIEVSCLIPPGNTYSIASTAGVPVGPYATELR